MHLTPGTRLGVYEVTALIGEGGMGQVYRATDTQLKRQVAIKILPTSLAADHDRLARFQREAEVLASLNHPHIAAIYGLEDADGVKALVMELVEGEDLSQRIARGAIPIDEALTIAKQIAEALEAAHEQGIIHRDLKPANIKVRHDGTVKLLDFGLARALDPAAAASGAGSSQNAPLVTAPTITSPALTQMGVILGTGAYMAPEQAKGRPADRRADVWAFGVVLFEMLTGKRLFDRADVSETLAAVMTFEPDWSQLATTPPSIRRLLIRCLAKDRRQRLDSMAAARLDLEDAMHAPQPTTDPAKRPLTVAVAAALTIAAFAIGWFASMFASSRTSRQPVSSTALVAEIPAPLDVIAAFSKGFALSPDGESLVFAARSPNGVRQLWLRRIRSASARPLAETEEGRYPFWSPDGAHIAFFTDTKLRRIPADGGEPQTLCDVFGIFPSGSWSVRDEILFGAAGKARRIYKVPAAGGAVTVLDGLGDAMRPVWLPDGKRFLYAVDAGGANTTLQLASANGGAPATITRLRAFSGFGYAPSGYVLMNRGDVLAAQRLDADAGALVGPVATIAGEAGTPMSWFAVSAAADRLVGYVRRSASDIGSPGDPWAKLLWVNRDGTPAGTRGGTARYWTLALSPDGKRVATNFSNDLWVVESDGRRTRITVASATAGQYSPVWSPDGSELAYRNEGPNAAQVMRQRLTGDSAAVALPDGKGRPTSWSPDGRHLLLDFTAGGNANQSDIHVYDFAARSQRPWLATEFSDQMAQFSPDGAWIAYASNSTGRPEVYVRRFEGPGTAIPVSSAGGIHPRWRRDGRELYFLGPGDEMMTVDMSSVPGSLAAGTPRKLFTVPLNDLPIAVFSPFEVTADGQKFLLNVPDRPEPLFFLQGLDALVRQAGAKADR